MKKLTAEQKLRKLIREELLREGSYSQFYGEISIPGEALEKFINSWDESAPSLAGDYDEDMNEVDQRRMKSQYQSVLDAAELLKKRFDIYVKNYGANWKK